MDFLSVFLFFVFVVGAILVLIGIKSLLLVMTDRTLAYLPVVLAFGFPGLLLLTCGVLLWE